GSRFFRFPQEIVLTRVQMMEELSGRLRSAIREKGSGGWLRLERAASGMARHSPTARLHAATAGLRLAAFRLRTAQQTRLTRRCLARIDRLAGRLDDLNPDRVLARGYSRAVLGRTGQTLTRASDATPGDRLLTHLAQGLIESRVTETGAAAPTAQ